MFSTGCRTCADAGGGTLRLELRQIDLPELAALFQGARFFGKDRGLERLPDLYQFPADLQCIAGYQNDHEHLNEQDIAYADACLKLEHKSLLAGGVSRSAQAGRFPRPGLLHFYPQGRVRACLGKGRCNPQVFHHYKKFFHIGLREFINIDSIQR